MGGCCSLPMQTPTAAACASCEDAAAESAPPRLAQHKRGKDDRPAISRSLSLCQRQRHRYELRITNYELQSTNHELLVRVSHSRLLVGGAGGAGGPFYDWDLLTGIWRPFAMEMAQPKEHRTDADRCLPSRQEACAPPNSFLGNPSSYPSG